MNKFLLENLLHQHYLLRAVEVVRSDIVEQTTTKFAKTFCTRILQATHLKFPDRFSAEFQPERSSSIEFRTQVTLCIHFYGRV